MGDEADTTRVETVETDVKDEGTGTTAVANSTSVLTGEVTETKSDTTDPKGEGDPSPEDTANTDKEQDGSGTGAEGTDLPPDTYADFVMPEGLKLDENLTAEATPIFKEMGATQEQAQKLMDIAAKQIQASSEKQVDDFNQMMTDWREQSKSDKEFGGDNFEKNIKVAQNAINKYGTSELKQLLDEHGVGNHPEVIRIMVRVGQTLKEDVPGSSGTTPTKSDDHVSILYPNSSG